jgi:hypothetical protein
MSNDLHTPKRTKGRWSAEHKVTVFGVAFRVYTRRADGFRRVEIEHYDVTMIVLYVTDDELRTITQTFAAAAGIGMLA